MSKPNKDDRGARDDTGTAPEAGDPQESGRSRGQVVEDGADRDAQDGSKGKTGEQPESGRQDAAVRAGE